MEESRILLEDPWFLVMFKPSGLQVEPDKNGHPNLMEQVEAIYRAKGALPGNFMLRVPHRIDRPTSGLQIISLRKAALLHFMQAFEQRDIVKEYLAVVEGEAPEAAMLMHGLRKDPVHFRAEWSDRAGNGFKEARLKTERLGVDNNRSLLRLTPETGRYHQIRAQLSAIGHPVINDPLYGAVRVDDTARIGLLASLLRFRHPRTQELITCITDPGEETWWDPFRQTIAEISKPL